ncbi:MAG TPA: MBL fold metallo-hydrolase [Chloroflexi bacterium]|jgi:phosphoribosyl 1,2-cyclic phosphate phosphodiesterase|nr:MBL fold metallo-hydrolase [Chloroflexota bacterium]
MRITFLGTGTSHGVPTIDCMLEDYAHCPQGVCRKAQHDPRYRRTRASILIETDTAFLLVDTSQDFYQQVLAHRVRRIDAVLYTHGHADHIYGLPDIRSHCRHQKGPIDIYGSQETLDALRNAFQYIFTPPEYVGGGIPDVRPHLLADTVEIGGLSITPVPVQHGQMKGCQGYRFDNVAYIPDVKAIPPESLERLRGLDLLILNCLRYRPHSGHLTLEESLAYARELGPRRCLFTHMTHDIDYAQEEKRLPDWTRFAYDGLVVEV